MKETDMATPMTDPPDTVTDADLDRVDRLDREATPGEWIAVYEGDGDIVIETSVRPGEPDFATSEDYALMRAARTLLPRLARALRAEREDQRIAAGECLVSLPEPGTDAARLLRANRLLSYERDKAQKEARDAYARGRREATDRLRKRAIDLDAKAEKHERECALNDCASAVATVWQAQANALRSAAIDIESL